MESERGSWVLNQDQIKYSTLPRSVLNCEWIEFWLLTVSNLSVSHFLGFKLNITYCTPIPFSLSLDLICLVLIKILDFVLLCSLGLNFNLIKLQVLTFLSLHPHHLNPQILFFFQQTLSSQSSTSLLPSFTQSCSYPQTLSWSSPPPFASWPSPISLRLHSHLPFQCLEAHVQFQPTVRSSGKTRPLPLRRPRWVKQRLIWWPVIPTTYKSLRG